MKHKWKPSLVHQYGIRLCPRRVVKEPSSLGRRWIRTLAPGDNGNGPLKGVKVLDLSRVLAVCRLSELVFSTDRSQAPLCTQLLGDYGADVIKVEDLDKGVSIEFVSLTWS